MPYKHFKPRVKVPVPPSSKVRGYVKVSINLLSRYSLEEVYQICQRCNISVLSSISLGGVVSKKYILHIEGYRRDITRLERLVNSSLY